MEKCKLNILKLMISGVLISSNLFCSQIAPNQDVKTYMSYYEDGVFDAIKQIKKSAEEGLAEYPLDKQIKGDIVVGIETDNMSVNDIVRIRTVSIKNNYTESVTAKNLRDGRGYVVFDSFDREADADYTIKRLLDYGVEAKKIHSGKWVKDPIVIRKIADDLQKGLFANMPVKVIQIERVIYKDAEGPKNTLSKTITSIEPSMPYQNENSLSSSKKSPKAYYDTDDKDVKKKSIRKIETLVQNIKSSAKFSFENLTFTYKGKVYEQGEKIDGYTITSAYVKQDGNKEKLVFKFDDYGDNHLIFTRNSKEKSSKGLTTSSSDEPTQKNDEDSQKAKKSATDIVKQLKLQNPPASESSRASTTNETNTINYYTCDFAQVRALFNHEAQKSQKIQETEYSYMAMKKEKVMHVSTDNEYVYFKANGLKPIGMNKYAWDQICKKL